MKLRKLSLPKLNNLIPANYLNLPNMKKSLTYTMVLLIFTFAANLTGYSQKAGSPFKGVINYKITYPEAKMEASQMAQMPQSAKLP
jgi:hypothetical protein